MRRISDSTGSIGRINLSLPITMHAAIKARPHVNWSEVARRAFEIELAKIERDWLYVSTPLNGKVKACTPSST